MRNLLTPSVVFNPTTHKPCERFDVAFEFTERFVQRSERLESEKSAGFFQFGVTNGKRPGVFRISRFNDLRRHSFTALRTTNDEFICAIATVPCEAQMIDNSPFLKRLECRSHNGTLFVSEDARTSRDIEINRRSTDFSRLRHRWRTPSDFCPPSGKRILADYFAHDTTLLAL